MGVFSSNDDRILAGLDIGARQPLQGVVVDNDACSVLVEFPRKKSPVLPIAEVVLLTLTATEPKNELAVQARVVVQSRRDDQMVYRFRLPAPEAPEVARMLRRRNAFRAKPDPQEPVHVLLHTESDRTSHAELCDLSTTGAWLVIDADDESHLCDDGQLKLSFRLPGEDALFELFADIRTRALRGSAIHYGVEFDAARTPRMSVQRERISSYVLERQLDMIRRAADA